jgi:hypothetical protein
MPPAKPVAPAPARPTARKPAPEPLDLDEPDERPAPRRERRPEPDDAPRGSLLWLWVLLGTGVFGFGLGAAVFFMALREKRTEKPVVEKPPVVQPAAPEPPKSDPPRTTPPKSDPPRTDPPKVTPPLKPKDPPPGVARTIPGLKLYLPLDAIADGKITETVSGRQIGVGVGVAVPDGPKGRPALRLTHDRKTAPRPALDLSDLRDAFAVPAGQPFTLAFWARRAHSDVQSGSGAMLIEATNGSAEQQSHSLRLQFLPGASALVIATLTDMSNRFDQGTVKTVQPSHNVKDASVWNHFILTRDETGTVRWMINGAESSTARPLPFAAELRYDSIALMRSLEAQTVIDLADFCLYDRALTDAELGTLTGLTIPPRTKPFVLAEGKLPAPGAVPAATDIKGLRFYLPCDQIENGAVIEAVSGKPVGKGRKLELVDGPRGKALRATAGGAGGTRDALDLTAHVDALAIEDGKPFTLALWVRTDDWNTLGSQFLDGRVNSPDRYRFFAIYRGPQSIGFLLNQGKPGGRPDPNNQYARGNHDLTPTKGWVHLALTRDERGTCRLLVDGRVASTSPTPYTAEVRFTALALGHQAVGSFTADFDEFCLFDRILTDDEIAKLAGLKPPAGAKEPIGPPKDPGAIGPRELAPPPREVAGAGAPKDPVVVGSPGPAAPPGVDSKGLKLYLPFEELKNGAVRDGVTGAFFGKCEGVDLVVSPRGKSARIAIDRADGGQGTCKLDFGDIAERVAVPAGKPFTLALWVRETARDPMSKGGSTVLRLGVRPNREYDRALQLGLGANGVIHFSARSTPDRLDPKRETTAQWACVANATKWQHVALVRDEKNVVRGYLNGKHVPAPGKPDAVWDGPLGYDRFLFGDPDQLRTVLEVDEFCLFERALTADELKKLAEPAK